MFEFCVEEIKGFDFLFLFLKNREIGNIRVNMEEGYKRADTVSLETVFFINSFQCLIQS